MRSDRVDKDAARCAIQRMAIHKHKTVEYLYLFGELDDAFDPRTRAVGHVIRSGIVQALSPLVLLDAPRLRLPRRGTASSHTARAVRILSG
jgi:hypothetical protein